MDRAPHRVVRIVNLVFLALGTAALVWMVQRIGIAAIGAAIASIGWWAVPLMASSLATLLLNTAAIRVFMRPEQRMVSYGRVLLAQLSGQAVNSVTPTGTVGEVLKVTMLMGHAPRYRAASSIVAFNVSVILTNACLVLFAMAVSVVWGNLSPRLDWLLQITMLLLLIVIVASLYLLRHGFVAGIGRVASKLHVIPPERREQILGKLESFDAQLRMFGPKKEASYTAGFVYVALARIVGWFDLWLILHALGLTEDFVFIVMAASVGMLIDRVASIVPLGIGAEEGGQAGLFELLGAGALIGLSLSLVSRIRVLLIAAIGLLAMVSVEFIDSALQRRARARIMERNRHLVESAEAPGGGA